MIAQNLIIIARYFKSILTEENPLEQSKMEHASMVLRLGLLPQRNKGFRLLFSGKFGYFQILIQVKALREDGSPSCTEEIGGIARLFSLDQLFFKRELEKLTDRQPLLFVKASRKLNLVEH